MKRYIRSGCHSKKEDVESNYNVGDTIQYDSNYLGVRPRMHTGTILSISPGIGTRGTPHANKIYKVEDENGRVYNIDQEAILESCNSSKSIRSTTYDFGRHDFAINGKIWDDFLDEIEYETRMEVDSAYRRKYEPWIELIDRDGTIYDAEITKYSDGTYEFRSENMSLQY